MRASGSPAQPSSNSITGSGWDARFLPTVLRRACELRLPLGGALPERDLTPDERVVLNAEVDAAISETVRFGEVLATRGVTTVALDDEGRITRHHPDGTTSLLP